PSSAEVSRKLDSPSQERKVSGHRIQGPAANAVLTTVVDTWGRSWTPRCPIRSSGLIRRTVVDSRGPGHSPEKQKVGGSTPSLTVSFDRRDIPSWSGFGRERGIYRIRSTHRLARPFPFVT